MLGQKQILIILLLALCYFNSSAQDSTIYISDDLKLLKISENFYIHVSYQDLQSVKHFPANGLIYLDGSDAYLVDTPWNNSLTLDLLYWLQDSLKVAVKAVIVTHWHSDCMGGLKQIHQEGITSYASSLTCTFTRKKNLPVPRICFKDSMVLDMTSQSVHIVYPGKGHAADNIVVWFPENKILFAGCLVKGIQWKGLGYTADADLTEWPETLNNLLEKYPNAKIVIPGHGAYGGINLIEHTIGLFEQHKK